MQFPPSNDNLVPKRVKTLWIYKNALKAIECKMLKRPTEYLMLISMLFLKDIMLMGTLFSLILRKSQSFKGGGSE